MERKPCHYVSSPAIWMVLVSPVRTEIIEALRLAGPCSIADIGAVIDRPADSLYKHVELLQGAGYLVEAGFRKGDRHIEQLFDVVADDFAIDFKDSGGAAENAAVVATANSFLKAMARALRDSAAARQLEFKPETRNMAINYELSWLTEASFQELRELIRRIKALMDEGKRRREGRLYMSLVIATPVTRRRGARGAKKAAAAKPAKPAKGGKKAGPLK